MDYRIITAPTVEPVTVEDLKSHMRIVGDTEDDFIETLGKAARQHVEWATGRTLMETTYEAIWDSFPCGPIKLPRAAPLQSVTSVKYTDSTGAITTVGTSYYVVNADVTPGLVTLAYGYSWPSFVPYPTGAVRIRYVAGNTISPLVDPEEGLIHAVKLLTGSLYENREAEFVPDMPGVAAVAMKFGINALLAQYMVDFNL